MDMDISVTGVAMNVPLSVLDFATRYDGEAPAAALHRCVDLAKRAEAAGYTRVWYTEHHNMPTVISSSPAIIIGYVASHTSRIRLGAGGVMLPNHSPLVIAEQFGALAEMYPGRIDLGLGRAPGTDSRTLYALRRDASAYENFPRDVVELQGFLGDASRVPGVAAYPGQGTHVPLIILGSSLFGADLAAQLGLPYSFASHFAPRLLHEAIAHYRENFQPSEELAEPYVIAAVNVTAAETSEAAAREFERVKRARVRNMLLRETPSRDISDADLDAVMDSAQARQILDMLRYTAVGDAAEVGDYLQKFARDAQADELMISVQATSHEESLACLELTARGYGLDS
ncbi:LLM class flavin-dependent oxidoreductase [Actinotignum schaalii]|uniref:Luciferase family oxidoreductase, group 1 n=1 Tax=Actinotignum schaalii FB123-CNA-2 TaxID=883067 RepID=S2WFG0_9ACTO|nr:LLM class flavin-dependent oxidoreductase [Actinotignum schaalii]EPD26634.1 luciferase family oxidoreductase, group 1 [Actinotignum schaalii FB123-CNA-2]